MPDRHFRRVRLVCRLGGRRLGPLTLGGADYVVGPLSVNDCLTFVLAVGAVAAALPKLPSASLLGLLQAAPALALRPLVPALVEGRLIVRRGEQYTIRGPVRRRHLRQMTDAQVLAVFAAAARANDFDYIFAALSPTGAPGEKRMGIEVLIHALVIRCCGAYTHDTMRALPMQQVLAIADAQRELDGLGDDEVRPVTADDPNVGALRALGLVN